MTKRAQEKPAENFVETAAAAFKQTAQIERLRTVPEVILLVVAVFLLVTLGYMVHSVLSPFVLVGAIVFLLYPLRHQPLPRRIMWLSIVLLTIWFFYSIFGLLVPFLLAYLIAYLINPVVTTLERKRFPRWTSSLLAVLVLVGIIVSVFLFVMPPAIQQFQGIVAGIKIIVADFGEMLKSGALFKTLSDYGISVDKAREVISQQITPRLENLLTTLFVGVFGFVTSVSSLGLQVLNAVIIPFITFYLLKDFPEISEKFIHLAPESQQSRFREVLGKTDALLGRYFRGAIMVALIQGTISAVGLWLIGVDYPLFLGIMSGILDFIPYVGLIISLVVSSIVAMFSGGAVSAKVIAVIILYLSQKLLEATILAPKIIGPQVGLHPVLLILCLMVFGYFLGFIGLLIAVPATALIIAGMKEWEERRSRSIELQEA